MKYLYSYFYVLIREEQNNSADNRRYRHDGRADKLRYQHDRRADSQCQVRVDVNEE